MEVEFFGNSHPDFEDLNVELDVDKVKFLAIDEDLGRDHRRISIYPRLDGRPWQFSLAVFLEWIKEVQGELDRLQRSTEQS